MQILRNKTFSAVAFYTSDKSPRISKVGRDLRNCLVQPPVPPMRLGQGAQGLTHSHCENLQRWRLHFSGQPVPLLDCIFHKVRTSLISICDHYFLSCHGALRRGWLSSPWPPCRFWGAAVKPPWSCLFSSLKKLSSLSWHMLQPLTSFTVSTELTSVYQYFVLEDPKLAAAL